MSIALMQQDPLALEFFSQLAATLKPQNNVCPCL